MLEKNLSLLRCPISRSILRLQIISTGTKSFRSGDEEIIQEGILYAEEDWFYPVIEGIPRLVVEAAVEYASFLTQHMPHYAQKRASLEKKYPGLLQQVLKKNRRTRESFSLEWSFFDYGKDKTWEAKKDDLLQRFLNETDEVDLHGKLIFDAGCGNGLLDQYIAQAGACVIAMDFSNSVVNAYRQSKEPGAIFIQGDVQFPPLAFECYDIVHSSGVLICTNNTELSFQCIEPCVRPGGKMSAWLYHPRKDRMHRLFNSIRNLTSKWPLRMNYLFLRWIMLPISYLIKRLKGNRQNKHEMMIELLDWFSPQFRWEHEHDEAAAWFTKKGYHSVKVTTKELFGFNIIGQKPTTSAPV
jgi:SAM-dependent methyltransferase